MGKWVRWLWDKVSFGHLLMILWLEFFLVLWKLIDL